MKDVTTHRLSYMAQATFWIAVLGILIGFFWLFKDVLAPFLIGFLVAYLLNPFIRKLQAGKISRKAATLGLLSAFFLTVFIVFAVISPIVIREIADFANTLPETLRQLWAQMQPTVNRLQAMAGVSYSSSLADTIEPFIGQATDTSKQVIQGIFSGGMAVINLTLTIFITPVVAYFLMKDWPHITNWIESLMPREHEKELHSLWRQIDRKIAGFIRGQLLVCVVLGVGYAIALTIAGLKYGFVIGLLSGLLSIIPFVGSAFGFITAIIMAWVQMGEISYVVIIAAIFLIGQFLEGNFISPKLVGNSVGMHPLWVLFSVMAGGAVLGILGMLIAVPVAATIGVLSAFFIQKYRKSNFYEAKGDSGSKSKGKAKPKKKSKKA